MNNNQKAAMINFMELNYNDLYGKHSSLEGPATRAKKWLDLPTKDSKSESESDFLRGLLRLKKNTIVIIRSTYYMVLKRYDHLLLQNNRDWTIGFSPSSCFRFFFCGKVRGVCIKQ